jgi:hypothetical protein
MPGLQGLLGRHATGDEHGGRAQRDSARDEELDEAVDAVAFEVGVGPACVEPGPVVRYEAVALLTRVPVLGRHDVLVDGRVHVLGQSMPASIASEAQVRLRWACTWPATLRMNAATRSGEGPVDLEAVDAFREQVIAGAPPRNVFEHPCRTVHPWQCWSAPAPKLKESHRA